MSYASVAARNAPPPSEQPRPDPGLLERPTNDVAGGNAAGASAPDVDSKINVVPHDYDGKTTGFSESLKSNEQKPGSRISSAKSDFPAALRNAELSAEAEGKKLGRAGKKELKKPEVQAYLVGAVNIAVVASVGLFAYKHWNERWDRRVVSTTVIGLGALFGSQGYFGWLFYGQ